MHAIRKMLNIRVLAIAILACIALIIRLYMLRFFDVISNDGIGYVSAARSLASGNIGGLTCNGFYVFLVWLFSFFTPNFEIAGRLVSVLFGSLLIVPLYLLGLEFFSRRTVLAACLVTLVWPSLLSWSCEVMTQATYTTLTVTACYLVWRMCRDETVILGLAAGFCIGLAFLTRTEAALLFFALPLVPLWIKRRRISAMWRPVLAYAGAIIFLCGIHILMLRVYTGSWQLSAKTSVALNDALGFYLKVNDYSYIPGIKQTSYFDLITNYPGFIVSNTLKNTIDVFRTTVPYTLWFLAIIGFISQGFSNEINKLRFFLLSTFSPLAVIVVFYYIGPEYTQPYLPVLFLLCAEGANLIELKSIEFLFNGRMSYIKKVFPASVITLLIACIYACMLLSKQIPATRDLSTYKSTDDGGRLILKQQGLIMKQYLPPGKIMVRQARIAYYADRDWVVTPNTDLEGIRQEAIRAGVRYIVIDNREQFRPLANDILSRITLNNHEVLEAWGKETPAKGGFRPALLYISPSREPFGVYEIVR